MTPAALLKHFEQITEGPDAIPRLRRFILDLAVRGKLVEQDPKDEPASELLNRILAEKAAHISKSKRAPANIQPIQDEEVPCSVSGDIVFARLEDIARIVKGATGIQGATPGPYPLVALAEKRSSCAEYQFDCAAAIVPLISSTGHGHASLKRMHYQEGKFALGNILCAVMPFLPDIISARYLYEYLWAYKEPLLVAKMIGTANVSLTIGKIGEAPIPIISPRQQKRLCELMVLCDELETAQQKRESRRDRLVAASLHALNNGDDTSEADDRPSFTDSTRFYLNHLPKLTTRPEHIKQLRQTILNLAVRGRLVPQDSNDKSIDGALDHAHERRAALVRTKKVRDKSVDGFDPGLPAGLPTNWLFERLGNLVDPENTISYGVLVPGDDVPDGIPFVRAQDLTLANHPERPNKTIAPEIEKPYARTRLCGGEILLCVVGSIGKLGVVPQTWAGANIARAVARIKPIPEICRDYLIVALRCKPVQEFFVDSTRTLAQPTLNVGLIEQTLIPLPPLAEQHRIVAKVDELMAVCDELERQITTAATTRRQFLEATLQEVL